MSVCETRSAGGSVLGISTDGAPVVASSVTTGRPSTGATAVPVARSSGVTADATVTAMITELGVAGRAVDRRVEEVGANVRPHKEVEQHGVNLTVGEDTDSGTPPSVYVE